MNKKEACKAAARAVARNCEDMSSAVYFDASMDDLVVVQKGGGAGRTIPGWKFLGTFFYAWGKTHNARAIGEEMRAQHIETRGLNLGVRVHDYL